LNFHNKWLKKRVLKFMSSGVGKSASLGDMRRSVVNHVK